MSGSNAAISPAREVLDQLDWLTAELEAQRPFLSRIPDVQLTAQPLPDEPSLLGLYQAMVERERGYLRQLGQNLEGDVPESIGDVLSTLTASRNSLLTALGDMPESAWGERAPGGVAGTLLEWTYQITLNDGEALRTIAERLHESQLSFGGRRADGP